MQSVTLIFSSPYPVMDTIEFLEGDSAFGAFSQRYNAFGNCVIGVGRESLFFSLPFL